MLISISNSRNTYHRDDAHKEVTELASALDRLVQLRLDDLWRQGRLVRPDQPVECGECRAEAILSVTIFVITLCPDHRLNTHPTTQRLQRGRLGSQWKTYQ